MFQAAEVGRKLARRDYERQLPELRAKLVRAQLAIKEANLPVIIMISGVDGAGKGEVVHRLNEWLDPRGMDIHAFWHEEDGERGRPEFWHFWQALPARGRVGILFGSWYAKPTAQRLAGELENAGFDAALRRIASFEEMLASDGAVIIKLWFHLSKKALHERLSKLVKKPETHWRVLPTDWAHHKLYDKFIRASERALRKTDATAAPWHLIESTDSRHRDFTAGRIILESIQKRLKKSARARHTFRPRTPRVRITTDSQNTILDQVPLGSSLPRWRYEEKLAKYQARLNRLAWRAHEAKIPTVMVFEGWDAAGKGSAIRRVTEAMDPRLFRVVPVGVPTAEEKAQHYLWRFWRNLPLDGRVTIFDRSWYGRVLVERVEKFAEPAEWMRAYQEINDFEDQLAEHGTALAKFWIHISKEEQLRRFKQRELVPFKRHKIVAEDWRNRARWDAYKAAINDMVAHTSTEVAPWTLVAGNDRRFARIQILKTLCDWLEQRLDRHDGPTT